jgi:subtilase family serine protease
MRRTRALALAAIATLALAAPGMVAASSSGGHYAHTYLHVRPFASTSPTGLSPGTIKSAYGFSTSTGAGAGKTIAIVDAYDLPTAANDLNVFSQQFGLPLCNTTNPCFEKVNQTGGTAYPRKDAGWGLEIALDIEWAHAIAPGAKILLVEASSNSFANLLAAEDYAKANAGYVSNSWGASEFSGETSYDSHFLSSTASIFVSSGDAGTPAEYPSASVNVISVGGTTLHFSGGNFSSETGWSGSGGGCSVYEAKPSAQSTGSVNCGTKRATPDISLDADPASGVSVYDSTRYLGQLGWWTVGGTSASSPMIAAHASVLGYTGNLAGIYALSTSTIRDITSGNNGASCLVGYDLVTGRGSWLG